MRSCARAVRPDWTPEDQWFHIALAGTDMFLKEHGLSGTNTGMNQIVV